MLEESDRDRPGQPTVLRRLLEIYHAQRDFGPYCRTCRRLLDIEPDNPPLHVMLAEGYLATAQMASALRTFRRFLDRWPDDPFAEGARDMVARLERAVDEMLENVPFQEGEKLELAAMHEEMMACLGDGEHSRVVTVGERLLARAPRFIPAINNLSYSYFWTGRAEKAIALSRRVLELDPDNFHALANLARYLLLGGRRDEAQAACEQLREMRSAKPEIWTKKAETFSYFGDDQAVLDMLDEARRAGATKSKTPDVAVLYHLAAVADARQGRADRARRLWRDALAISPTMDLASENLADAKKPIAERHGPWAYTLDYWVRPETVRALAAAIEGPARRKDEESVTRAARAFAEKHPEMASLVPALLDRGGEDGRQFAWRFARLVETPEMVAALREFCLSDRGPDDLRIETANYLCRENVLPSGRTRMWIGGRWGEIELLGFEITEEPTGPLHAPPVDDWAYDAMQALRCGDGKLAQSLLEKCLERVGDAPDLLNNLAVAYETQGRRDEATQLLRQIHERWPDYFFGRVGMAKLAIRAGDFERAEEYLAPLRHRRRLHMTEFAQMCSAHVAMFLGRREIRAARSWFEMWKQIDPDNPELKRFLPVLALGNVVAGLPRLFESRRKPT